MFALMTSFLVSSSAHKELKVAHFKATRGLVQTTTAYLDNQKERSRNQLQASVCSTVNKSYVSHLKDPLRKQPTSVRINHSSTTLTQQCFPAPLQRQSQQCEIASAGTVNFPSRIKFIAARQDCNPSTIWLEGPRIVNNTFNWEQWKSTLVSDLAKAKERATLWCKKLYPNLNPFNDLITGFIKF